MQARAPAAPGAFIGGGVAVAWLAAALGVFAGVVAFVEDDVDAGDLLAQVSVPLLAGEMAGSAMPRLAALGAPLGIAAAAAVPAPRDALGGERPGGPIEGQAGRSTGGRSRTRASAWAPVNSSAC